MRLVSFDDGTGPRAGVLTGGEIAVIAHPARTVRGLLGGLDAAGVAELGERAIAAGERVGAADVRLLRAGPRTRRRSSAWGSTIAITRRRAGLAIPSAPMFFAKFANSLVRTGEAIIPGLDPEQVDYEAELAVVIGRRRAISPSRARSTTSRAQWRSTTSAPEICSCEPALDRR